MIPGRPLSGREIIAKVAAEHRMTVDDLTGPSRVRAVCIPRWRAMREMRERGLSLTRIGELLNRDHTTIVHGLRRAG